MVNQYVAIYFGVKEPDIGKSISTFIKLLTKTSLFAHFPRSYELKALLA